MDKTVSSSTIKLSYQYTRNRMFVDTLVEVGMTREEAIKKVNAIQTRTSIELKCLGCGETIARGDSYTDARSRGIVLGATIPNSFLDYREIILALCFECSRTGSPFDYVKKQ